MPQEFLQRSKLLLPADLSLAAKDIKTTPHNGAYLQAGGYKGFTVYVTIAISGGDRAAGSAKLTLECYETVGGVLLLSQPLMTAINRFSAGTTTRNAVGFGDGTTPTVSGTAGATVGAGLAAIRGFNLFRLVLETDAAYSGGTTDPTTATANVWMHLRT